jgi:hypothetical protein
VDGVLVAGCMAALQAEHFLQLNGSSFEDENGSAATGSAEAPLTNGNLPGLSLNDGHAADKKLVAAL